MTDRPTTEQPPLTEKQAQAIWNSLTVVQRQFVIARLIAKNDAAACKAVGIQPSAASNWGAYKQDIDRYVIYQRANALQAAKFILAESTLEAVGVLVKELRGRRRITAAKEILDRAGLPAITRQELTGLNSGPIEVKAVDYRNGIAEVAPRSISDSDTPGEI